MADNSFDLVIGPQGGRSRYFKDLWAYRELFYFLAWRDVIVRYKQTALGAVWSILRPITMMVVFTVVFGGLAKMPSEGAAPYALMVFAATLPWQFFSDSLVKCSGSVVSSSSMITKIYFPRLIVPVSAVMVSVVDLLVATIILAGLMIWFQYAPSASILSIPLFMLLGMGVSLGGGLWFAALNVKYRDFNFIVPFLTQLMLYISPVGFSSSVVPEKWRLAYSLNPMVGVIDGFRWAILGGQELYIPSVAISALMAALLLATGMWFFRKTERAFADII
ncbi:MAG: ABC transporter permease [Nitrospinae bacterium]|nr:ABC transporter permease [Nitrospinota bacterium]